MRTLFNEQNFISDNMFCDSIITGTNFDGKNIVYVSGELIF